METNRLPDFEANIVQAVEVFRATRSRSPDTQEVMINGTNGMKLVKAGTELAREKMAAGVVLDTHEDSEETFLVCSS